MNVLPDEIKKEVLLEDEKQNKSLSIMKLSLKFSSLLTTKLNTFIYNRIEVKIFLNNNPITVVTKNNIYKINKTSGINFNFN